MLGQTSSNLATFSIEIFVQKICVSCLVLSQDSITVIYFYIRQLEMPKIVLQ